MRSYPELPGKTKLFMLLAFPDYKDNIFICLIKHLPVFFSAPLNNREARSLRRVNSRKSLRFYADRRIGRIPEHVYDNNGIRFRSNIMRNCIFISRYILHTIKKSYMLHSHSYLQTPVNGTTFSQIINARIPKCCLSIRKVLNY